MKLNRVFFVGIFTSLLLSTSNVLAIRSGTITATGVDLYVDSAPNVYGSPDWAPWWDAAKSDVVAGNFTDLRTGTHPGSDIIDPYDEIVYSTGDLGKRLHWIYWVPEKSTTSLDGLFEVKWVIDWGGSEWMLDENGAWVLNDPDAGWSQPSSWEDYDGGVIGSLGFAWWSTDNDAPPIDTDGSPYNEVDQADIDALRSEVFNYQTFAQGLVRYRANADSQWETQSLTVFVPDGGSTLAFLGIVLAGAVGLRRKLCR